MTTAPLNTDLFSRRYILQDQLGLGGMGAVYKAIDRLTGDVLALKRVYAPVESFVFIPEDEGEDLRIALAQEFQTLASLRHPHIISVLEFGFDQDQQPYFTMELMHQARTIVGASRFRDNTTKVDYLIQTLRALEYLHHRGILHRDLKPGNVLVQEDHVKILDFGLAIDHTAVPEEAVGTVSYMSPELLEEHPPSIASDLFAVGVMAFEMFAGEHPFDPSGNIMELIYRITVLEPEYARLELNVAATAVIQTLLEKDPIKRYQRASDVIEDLSAAFGLPLPEETEDIRESFLVAAKFVGREHHLQKLDEAVKAVMQGQGSAWLIGGESGVGKTRLLEEVRVRALVAGAEVLRGESQPDGGLPYQLWRDPIRRLSLTTELDDLQVDILRQLIPDITTLLEREPGDSTYTGRQALVDTIISVLHRQQHPTVLILEDLQWASEGLEILKRISRTVESFPILILGSFRNDERPSLPEHLPDMQTIFLNRLDAKDIEALSYSMLGTPGRDPGVIKFLQMQTEGNVFFLVEIARALAEEAGSLDQVGRQTLPIKIFTGGMEAIVQRRLSQVPAWGQSLIEQAAVAGRELDLKILGKLLPTLDDPPDLQKWLLSCANAAVLEVREGRWRFAHDKLRQGAVLGIEEDRLPLLNRQVAEAIEDIYHDAPEYAGKLAQHWSLAGDLHKQWHYAKLAGEQALELSAYPDAVSYFQMALDIGPQIGMSDSTANIMCRLGRTHRYMGDFDNARTLLIEALSMAEEQQDTATTTEALIQLGVILVNRGEYGDAPDYLLKGLDLAREIDDKTSEAVALSQLGEVARVLGNYDDAISYHQQSLAIARKINHLRYEGISLDSLGSVYSDLGQHDRAIEYRLDSLELIRRTGNRRSEGITLTNLGRTYATIGEFEQALGAYRMSLAIVQDVGDLAGEGICLDVIADAYKDTGDFDQALEHYTRSLNIARETNNRRHEVNRLIDLAHVHLNLGRPEESIQLCKQAYDIALELDDVDEQCLASYFMGWAYLAKDHVDQARTYFYRAAVTLQASVHSYRAAASLGVATLRDRDDFSAKNAFHEAIEQTEAIIDNNDQAYRSWLNKGLALAGLYMMGEQPLEAALSAYQEGLKLAAYPGLLIDTRRKLEALIQTKRADLTRVTDLVEQARLRKPTNQSADAGEP